MDIYLVFWRRTLFWIFSIIWCAACLGVTTVEDSKDRLALKVLESINSNRFSRSQFPSVLKEEDLLWKMNNAGFYNHVFDFKYVMPFAKSHSRRVFVEPLRSPHYENQDLNICDYLDIPNLHCLPKRLPTIKCGTHFQNIIGLVMQNKTRLCFAESAFNRTNLSRQRFFIYLSPEPRLRFQQKYVSLYKALLNAVETFWPKTYYDSSQYFALNRSEPLWNPKERYRQHNFGTSVPRNLFQPNYSPQVIGPNSNTQQRTFKYIIVHWRRGDQLETRCDENFIGSRDLSPNCAGIEEFLLHLHHERIRFPPEIRFFIATNEKNPRILRILRQHQYIILSDLLHSFRYDGYNLRDFRPNTTMLEDYSFLSSIKSTDGKGDYFQMSNVFHELHEQQQVRLKEAEKKRKKRRRRQKDKKFGSLGVNDGDDDDGDGGEDTNDQRNSNLKVKVEATPKTTTDNSPEKKKTKKVNSFRNALKKKEDDEEERRILLEKYRRTQSFSSTNVSAMRSLSFQNSTAKKTDINTSLSSKAKKIRINLSSNGGLTHMDEFIIESLFMLHGTVLINFGISTIHDAIESERYLQLLDQQNLGGSPQSRGDEISVCYMAQDQYSWCHAFGVELNYRRNKAPCFIEDKKGGVKRFDRYNLLPAYPNTALILPEETM